MFQEIPHQQLLRRPGTKFNARSLQVFESATGNGCSIQTDDVEVEYD